MARKLGNIGSLDPELRSRGIVGLAHASKVEKEVWDEYHSDWQQLILEADRVRGEYEGRSNAAEVVGDEFSENHPAGHPADAELDEQRPTEVSRLRRVRVGQDFFRQSVLSGYESVCCVTGIDVPQCLIASHIIPWSERPDVRLNPANGLCLSATFDRLFDSGLMTISGDYTVVLSRHVLETSSAATRDAIAGVSGRRITRPHRFVPPEEFLEWHRENIFVT